MKRSARRSALGVVSLLCAVLLAACGGSSTPTLRGLTVSPTTASIDTTTTQQFTATAYYSDGSTNDVTSTVGWVSSNPSVATIGPDGVAAGLANGTVTITASIVGATATATLTVARTLKSIAITPVATTVPLGTTVPYTATGTFLNSDGTTSTSDITSEVAWSSGTPATATIDNTGLATTLAAGTTSIKASLAGFTSNTSVLTVGAAAVTSLQVTPAAPTLAVGNTTALLALELFSDGTTQPLTGPVTWALSDCSTAGATWLASTTTNGTEVAVGALAGGCTVTATEGALTGTSTVTVVTGSAHFAYVANPSSSTISQYSVDATSATPLTPLTPATVTASIPAQVVIHPNGLYAYAININSVLYLYDVDTGGAGTLTLDPNAPNWTAGLAGDGYWVAIDPSGRFLYVSDDLGNTINGFTIDQTTGFLTAIGAVTGYNVNLGSPEQLLIDRTGKWLYAINNTSAVVSAYTIQQTTGALTPLAPTATFAVGTSPFFGSISPSNAAVYVANSGDNTVTALGITSTNGALTTLSTTPVAATFVLNTVVDPTSTYLYVLDTGDPSTTPTPTPGAVYGFTLAANGAIGAAISGTPVATGLNPLGIIMDPTGTLLAVDNNYDNTISPFSVVTTTGAPTADATVATDQAPQFVTFLNAP